jgi:hypothetical protein
MPEPEELRKPDAAQSAWKSQEEGEGTMQVALTPDQIANMARSREKLNTRLAIGVLAVAVALAAALLYNVYRLEQPWIRIGQAWTLGVIVYLVAPEMEWGRRRKGSSEPCASFLARQYEERRAGYRRIRNRLFLLIPGMAATWWGRRLEAGPWLFVFCGAALVLVWLAFGKAAEKAARDSDETRRSIGQ